MGRKDLPAHNIFAVGIARVRSEVANDIVVGIGTDNLRSEALSCASKDLDGSRADSPVKFKGAYSEVDGIRRTGGMVGVLPMASCGLPNDILVRIVNERNERPLTLQFERA